MRRIKETPSTPASNRATTVPRSIFLLAIGAAFGLLLAPILQPQSLEILQSSTAAFVEMQLSTPPTAMKGNSIKGSVRKEEEVAATKPGTREWDDWPAVAYEEVGHPLVTKGDSFFHHARDLFFKKSESGGALMDEFLEVYKSRPDPVNLCGIRINHAMALYLAVKQLQPTLVVESGVNQGVSTYFIRAASSTTKIFAIDPLDKPICDQGDRWIDSSKLTTYYTGKEFVDLLDLNWKWMIEQNEVNPERTLVFLDDHLHAFQRIAGVLKHGI